MLAKMSGRGDVTGRGFVTNGGGHRPSPGYMAAVMAVGRSLHRAQYVGGRG